MRDADQFHVGEHHAGTLVAIIQQCLDTGGLQRRVQLLRRIAHRSALAHADRHDGDLERRHRRRQDNAALVVILLDGGGHDARHADAVAAHFHDLRLALRVQKGGFHSFGIFGAQLENVSDLDAATDFQRALAVRRWVACNHIADVGEFDFFCGILLEVLPVASTEVVAVFIGAADEIAHHASRMVCNYRDVMLVVRADITGTAAHVGLDFVFGGEAEIAQCGNLVCLDFVQGMIAAQQQQGKFSIFAYYCDGLENLLRRNLKEGGDFLNGFLPRGGDFLQGFCGCRTRCVWRNGFRHFNIRGVIGSGAVGQRVFAGIRQHMKLVRTAAADRAGIRRDRAELQPETGKDMAVGVMHGLIGMLQARVVGMKRIGILHHEFARAHHAEARAHLVAELGLDLVEVDRQLAVAADFAARDVGDHFLVGRAEAEVVIVPILDFQHLRAEHFPAPGFLPQFGGLHGGHQQLDAAAPVHFLAHDVFHLAQHAQTERHPGIQAAGQLPDIAGAQHQLMAGQFRLGWGFFQGGDKKL